MATRNDPRLSIPVVEERASIHKHKHETDRVRVRTFVDQALERVGAELEHDDVRIERVAIDQEVTEAPQVREENGVLVVTVLEEVLVVQKRLVLKEELHIHRNRTREHVEQAVAVRRMRAEVARVPTGDGAGREKETGREELASVRRPPRIRRKPPLTGR
jgi:stress response protein YsnF